MRDMGLNCLHLACLLSAGLAVSGSQIVAQGISDNDAVVEQFGSDNQALIDQAGTLNRAGSTDRPLVQYGIFNDIDILQAGNGNTIGLSGSGLSQTGHQNTAAIFNQITIEQRSNNNAVGSVTQTSQGSVVNGANTLIIRQDGAGNNIVETVRQTQQDGQAAQRATITQSGEFNRVALIDQLANSNAQNEDNVITLRITGVRNGQIGLSGYAAIPDTIDSGIIQQAGTGDIRSNGNRVDLLIIGDDTRFGIRQAGRMNDVGFITVIGSANQLGLRQGGTENDIVIGDPIEGDDNAIGIDQLGTNTVTLSLEALSQGGGVPRSDRNTIFIRQDGTNEVTFALEGDDNDFTIDQDFDTSGLGGSNTAILSLFGDRNIGRVSQFGENMIVIEITGNDNNASAFGPGATLPDVIAGDFVQDGSGNIATITVLGDINSFGTRQTGSDNSIFAIITGGGNQAAIAQTGRANIAEMSQKGRGNTARIIQN